MVSFCYPRRVTMLAVNSNLTITLNAQAARLYVQTSATLECPPMASLNIRVTRAVKIQPADCNLPVGTFGTGLASFFTGLPHSVRIRSAIIVAGGTR